MPNSEAFQRRKAQEELEEVKKAAEEEKVRL